METIALTRVWRIGNPLASGGFGRIYEARAEDGSEAVVKLVPKVPGARRELLFENLSGLPNIIPIFEIGEWNESYVIVMPRAAQSLRQHLESSGGRLSYNETVAVLTDVAQGLAALNGEVVHRNSGAWSERHTLRTFMPSALWRLSFSKAGDHFMVLKVLIFVTNT